VPNRSDFSIFNFQFSISLSGAPMIGYLEGRLKLTCVCRSAPIFQFSIFNFQFRSLERQ